MLPALVAQNSLIKLFALLTFPGLLFFPSGARAQQDHYATAEMLVWADCADSIRQTFQNGAKSMRPLHRGKDSVTYCVQIKDPTQLRSMRAKSTPGSLIMLETNRQTTTSSRATRQTT
jgi:hypothetical protein